MVLWSGLSARAGAIPAVPLELTWQGSFYIGTVHRSARNSPALLHKGTEGKTAQFCRTRDTGHLMGLGPIEVTEDINHQIGQRAGFDVNVARFKRLAEMPAAGTNTLLVSHTHGSPRVEERIMGGIQEAEIVVYQPDGKGGSEPVARIPVPEWEMLIKASPAIPVATAPAKAPTNKSQATRK